MFFRILFLTIILFITSCVGNNRVSHTDGVVIRTANLRVIYSFLYNSNNKALDFKKKFKFLQSKIKEFPANKQNTKNVELLHYKTEISKIKDQNKILKDKIIQKINKIVRKVSLNNGYDIVLNQNDSVLFSKNTYDITSDIIKELKKNAVKNSLSWK